MGYANIQPPKEQLKQRLSPGEVFRIFHFQSEGLATSRGKGRVVIGHQVNEVSTDPRLPTNVSNHKNKQASRIPAADGNGILMILVA